MRKLGQLLSRQELYLLYADLAALLSYLNIDWPLWSVRLISPLNDFINAPMLSSVTAPIALLLITEGVGWCKVFAESIITRVYRRKFTKNPSQTYTLRFHQKSSIIIGLGTFGFQPDAENPHPIIASPSYKTPFFHPLCEPLV
jgi:hypothetical protein